MLKRNRLILGLSSVALLSAGAVTAAGTPPRVHLNADLIGAYLDGYWCHLSAIPVQDPVFPTIRRDAFTEEPATGLVRIPPAWIKEASETRWPQLTSAADQRLPKLLAKVESVVGRPFV